MYLGAFVSRTDGALVLAPGSGHWLSLWGQIYVSDFLPMKWSLWITFFTGLLRAKLVPYKEQQSVKYLEILVRSY